MIAWTGYEMFKEGYVSDFDMTQIPKWPLDELMDEAVGWKSHQISIWNQSNDNPFQKYVKMPSN